MNAVAVPVHSDVTPYITSTASDSLLSPLHDGVLECMELLQKVSAAHNFKEKKLLNNTVVFLGSHGRIFTHEKNDPCHFPSAT